MWSDGTGSSIFTSKATDAVVVWSLAAAMSSVTYVNNEKGGTGWGMGDGGIGDGERVNLRYRRNQIIPSRIDPSNAQIKSFHQGLTSILDEMV